MIPDKKADEFLEKIGIGGKPDPTSKLEEQPIEEKASKKKKEDKVNTKTANLRVLLTSDQKIKFQILGVSPRMLCETFLAEYLERDEIKEKLKTKIKELK